MTGLIFDSDAFQESKLADPVCSGGERHRAEENQTDSPGG